MCESVQSVINLFRVHHEQRLETTYAILAREAPCQQPDYYDKDYGGKEDYDDHNSFMTSVCNLVGTFDHMMGLHFVQADGNVNINAAKEATKTNARGRRATRQARPSSRGGVKEAQE